MGKAYEERKMLMRIKEKKGKKRKVGKEPNWELWRDKNRTEGEESHVEDHCFQIDFIVTLLQKKKIHRGEDVNSHDRKREWKEEKILKNVWK